MDAPPEEVPADWEDLDEVADEWDGDDNNTTPPAGAKLTPEQRAEGGQEGRPSGADPSREAGPAAWAPRALEAKREDAWRAYDQTSRDIDRQQDALLDEISRRLEQRIEQEPLFALRWHLA